MSTGKRPVLSAIVAAAAIAAIGGGVAHADPASDPTSDVATITCDMPDCGTEPATEPIVEHHLVDEEPAPEPVIEATDEEAAAEPIDEAPPVEDAARDEEPITVEEPIPGAAPSRPLVLVPVASTRPVTEAAAIDKSKIIYTAHPVPHVTDADISAGLQAAGVNPRLFGQFDTATRTIMGGESGGATNAVNRGDSNAWGARQPDGAPAGSSRGLMQTVPGTFAANHAPGTSTFIYDPVANIAAAWRYIAVRYHVDLHTGTGLVTFMARGVGHGVGY